MAQKKTYIYQADDGKGNRILTYDWVDDDGNACQRTVTNSNPNAFWFLIDALDRLGYTCTIKK